MSNKSEYVKKWRRNTKKRIVDAFGGKCCICGYDKCVEALELHHLNPKEKEFSFGNIRANIQSWGKIVNELKKCICVCSNRHKEIHYMKIEIKTPIMFNEEFTEYRKEKHIEHDKCPVCKKDKPIVNKYCSKSCAAKMSRKVDWDNIDLKLMIEQKMPYVLIAEKIGVSDVAVRKRAKKLGLI